MQCDIRRRIDSVYWDSSRGREAYFQSLSLLRAFKSLPTVLCRRLRSAGEKFTHPLLLYPQTFKASELTLFKKKFHTSPDKVTLIHRKSCPLQAALKKLHSLYFKFFLQLSSLNSENFTPAPLLFIIGKIDFVLMIWMI